MRGRYLTTVCLVGILLLWLILGNGEQVCRPKVLPASQRVPVARGHLWSREHDQLAADAGSSVRISESKAESGHELLIHCGHPVQQLLADDLESDGLAELLVLTRTSGTRKRPRGGKLAIYSLAKGRARLLWEGLKPEYNAWHIDTADVEGDGCREILVCAWKRTEHDPHFGNRPFLYQWEKDQLVPKWLGSRLSRPFLELAAGDLTGDGKDRLVAIEVTRSGGNCLTVYRWHGFGFEGEWQGLQRPHLQDLRLINLDSDGKVEIAVAENIDGREETVVLSWSGTRLERVPRPERRHSP